MPSSKPRYVVDGRSFTSQKQLVEHIRGVFRRHRPGSVLNGSDFTFVRALLERHPRAREKVSSGVQAIRVEWNPVWNNQPMFVVVRTDGTETDFSFWKCVRPRPRIADFHDACRTAVVDDILSFKREYFTKQANEAGQVQCPLTGRWLSWHDGHVDHMPPWTFRWIVRTFLERERIDPAVIQIDGFADGEILKRFADASLSERFRRFHNRLARLRIIDARENLRLPK